MQLQIEPRGVTNLKNSGGEIVKAAWELKQAAAENLLDIWIDATTGQIVSGGSAAQATNASK